MGIQKELVIDLVLTLRSHDNSAVLGPALWAGLAEVGNYFTPGSSSGWLEVPLPTRSREQAIVRPRFRRWYVATAPPPFPLEEQGMDSEFVLVEEGKAREIWERSQQRRTQHDHAILGPGIAAHVTDIAGTALDSAIIVVDRELIPPPDWRYVLWSSFPGGAVISIAPMDPDYWGAPAPHSRRKQEIKQGMRAAALCVAGTRIGLSRCENPGCFMFAAVDSVSRLPEMRQLGTEHTVTGLDRGIFPSPDPDPERVTVPLATEGLW